MSRFQYFPLACLILVLSACATTTIDEYRAVDKLVTLSDDEKFIVLGRQDAGHYITGTDFARCVGK